MSSACCGSSPGCSFCSTAFQKPLAFNFLITSLNGLLILATLLEIVGSVMLVFGAYTRIVAFILSGEMAFAYFMAHAPRSFYPIVNGGEAAVLFCFVFLYLAFAGGGPLSLDRMVLKQK